MKNITILHYLLLLIFGTACQKNVNPSSQETSEISKITLMEEKSADGTFVYKTYQLNHPTLLHKADDFTYVRSKVTAKAEPWYSGWQKLINNPYSKLTYKPSPTPSIERGGLNNWNTATRDAQAAYQHALIWKIGGDEDHARKSIEILNQWATICKQLGGDDSGNILVAAFVSYQFANAAEIMRTYSEWKSQDFNAFKTWMKGVFLPFSYNFINNRTDLPGMGWISWEGSSNLTILSIGVLCDDQELINYAIKYYYQGSGPGSIKYMTVDRHEDPDGLVKGKNLAQSVEMGRDQGHAAIAVPVLGAFCQTAYNIGEDLFKLEDNKLLALCEYFAKYNVNPDKEVIMPFTRYYTTKDGGKWQEKISSVGRGETRAGWELIYNHYVNIKGVSAPYTKQFAEKVRPEGGMTDFTGGGRGDQLGFGTLMFSREPR